MFDVFRRHYDTMRNADTAVPFIEEWLQTTGTRVKGALLSTAWKEPSVEGASFVIGKLLLMEELILPRRRHVYPSLRLEESWIDRHELVTLVRMLLSEQRSSQLPELFHNPNAEQICSLRTLDLQSGWAEIQLKLTCRANRVAPEWLPAVAPDLPPFQTWAQATTMWVFNRPVTYGADIPYNGQLVVVLPDTQARATLISQGSHGIDVHVEVNGAPAELELHYLFSRSRVRLAAGVVSFSETGTIEVPSHAEAAQLDVFCVHRTRGFISHTVFSWSELSAAGCVTRTDDRLLVDEIAGGERETVEFKPFVCIDSDKINELVRTIVAFSNTDGGRIYVGVHDDGRPQGRAALRRFCSSNDPEGLSAVVAGLKKVIQDKIKPVPEAVVRTYELAGEPICIIELPAGEFVYSTHDNEILIRKGSTNRKPDPASELEPLFARRRAGSRTDADPDAEDVY